MILIYSICVLIAALLCICFFYADMKNSVAQKVMLLIVLISNMGYLSLAMSTDLSGAILSNKIMYLGGCFLPMLFLFTVCEVCHVKLNKIVITIMSVTQSIIYGIVCTTGYGTLYYKSAEFNVVDGVGTISKEYGPLHFLYPATMYLYLIIAMIIAIVVYVKKKNVNRRGLMSMIIFSLIAAGTYVTQRKLMAENDIMPVSYIVMIIGALIPIYKSNLFDVQENKEVINEQLEKIGFITFNRNMEYMGANEYALNIFGSLQSENVGQKIKVVPENIKLVYEQLEKFIIEHAHEKVHYHEESITVKINDKAYETSIHSILDYRRKCVGVMVEIRDITEHTRMIELTEKYNEELSKEVELKTQKIRSIQEKTILGIAQMVESRDTGTGGHIKRTSEVIKIFSKKLLEKNMGFDKHFLDLLIRSAPMHDLGKIGVDDAVLKKTDRFTDEEYEQMKKHSEIGGQLVKDILTGVEDEEFVRIAYNVANYHHEKVNGTGYPEGLKGEEIPVEARIMALADVFDALVSKRCYKEAYSYDTAFNIIEKDAGVHFDKELAKVFLECRPQLEAYYNE